MEPEKKLSVHAVSAGYHGSPVLSGITFNVSKGELFSLVGPNGAGKTTLLKVIVGLTKPLSGAIQLDSKPLSDYSSYERASKIAYVAQGSGINWPFTVHELVSQGRFPSRKWFGSESAEDTLAVEEALEITDLLSFKNRLVTELSGGELQRVLIARALAQKPELLVLDEPVSHLDIRYQVGVMELIQSLVDKGLSAVISLHDLNLASLYAHTVGLIAQGTMVCCGSVSEVLTGAVLQNAYNIELEVGKHPQNPLYPMIYFKSPRRIDPQDR